MYRRGRASLLALALLALAAGIAVAADPPPGFSALFNGRDLAGWRMEGDAASRWQVRDGVIDYDGKGKDLWSEREYGDFILNVDWRLMTPGGDCGIYEIYGYRTDRNMPEEVRKGVTPLKRADRPVGEWNSFTITMRGDRVTVDLNGERVINNAQLPGVKPRGPIALQNHGNPLQFRNISIRELP
jgi:hypothetical protein